MQVRIELAAHIRAATNYAEMNNPKGREFAQIHIRKALGLANTQAPELKPQLLRCLNFARRPK